MFRKGFAYDRYRQEHRKNHAAILKLWTEFAEKAASARGLTGPAFVNMIGAYLSQLAAPHAEGDETRQALLEQHLSTRLRQGFEVAEMVGEISLLGQCVASLWTNSNSGERPDPVAVHEFYARLQRDSTIVSSVFTQHMLEDEQREKRFRRLIRDVAYEGMQPGQPPLEQRYAEILGLVMQAMEAQTAALLMLDPTGKKLEIVAAVGVGHEQIQSLETHDHLSWLREQAEAKVSRSDESSSEVEISDSLREAGVHSLMSTPIASRSRALLGIMLVGTVNQRSFSSRERRSLEALAEQLTLHLDAALLFANLATTIVELHEERSLRELFVAVLAHDLRGPLSAAKTGAQLLAKPDLLGPAEQAEIEGMLEHNIDLMDRMIRDLLDVSKVQAGQQLPLQPVFCNLDAIAREVVQQVSQTYKKPFNLEIGENICGLWSPDELRRALWNLATNALKYGDEGETVTVAVESTKTGARVSVHNLGPAIPLTDQTNLFQPFSRTLNSEDGTKPGWGLGLALVRACADAHGGLASVRSDDLNGTTFFLDLPLDAAAHQRSHKARRDDARLPLTKGFARK